MPGIVAIVGRSNSGKTRLVTRLIKELRARHYHVATIKHAQELDFEAGKDSQVHLEFGSECTVLVGPDRIVTFKPFTSEPSVENLAKLIGVGLDIVLVEGFKKSSLPKMVVHRNPGEPMLENLTNVVAVVTEFALDEKVRQFKPDDIAEIANFLEESFIKPSKQELNLYVNGKPVPLTQFPKGIIRNVVLAMVDSLKDTGEVHTVEINLSQLNEAKEW